METTGLLVSMESVRLMGLLANKADYLRRLVNDCAARIHCAYGNVIHIKFFRLGWAVYCTRTLQYRKNKRTIVVQIKYLIQTRICTNIFKSSHTGITLYFIYQKGAKKDVSVYRECGLGRDGSRAPVFVRGSRPHEPPYVVALGNHYRDHLRALETALAHSSRDFELVESTDAGDRLQDSTAALAMLVRPASEVSSTSASR